MDFLSLEEFFLIYSMQIYVYVSVCVWDIVT